MTWLLWMIGVLLGILCLFLKDFEIIENKFEAFLLGFMLNGVLIALLNYF